MRKEKEENIYNAPNFISLLRLLASPILVLLVFHGINIWILVILFAIAALTDALDGFIARRFDLVTRFGRKIDIIADRVLMISLILAILSYLTKMGIINSSHIFLISLIMSREIFAFPFVLAAIASRKRILPHARNWGKLMTLMQGVTFPMIILGWAIALPLAVFTFIIGLVCAGYYAYDAVIKPNNAFQIKMDKYYSKL